MGARYYKLSTELLVAYQNAALRNANSLLEESRILLKHKKYARAYFLAVAAMEETGKAYHAFAGRGRDLTNPAIQHKLKGDFENHMLKIAGAFNGEFHFLSPPEQAAKAKAIMDSIFLLLAGREDSMYVDVRTDNSLKEPLLLTHPVAARRVYSLAFKCYSSMVKFVNEAQPLQRSTMEDKAFVYDLEKMMTKAKDDFGEFLLDSLSSQGVHFNFDVAAVRYHDEYYVKKKRFKVYR